MTSKSPSSSPSEELLAWASRLHGAEDRGNRALFLAREEIVRAIDRAVGFRLPTLLVKGVGLALTAYPSAWMRPMSDIDLMVAPSRLEELARVLGAAGFRRLVDDERSHTTSRLEVILEAPAPLPSIAIELHGSLDKVAPRALPFDGLWQRGLPHGEGLMRAPSLEDHLVLVAIHLANDEFEHALGLADVDALLRAGVDVALAEARAESCGARTALRLALEATRARRGDTRDVRAPRGLREQLVARWFDPTAWPIGKSRAELGWRWIAKQALLRDDGSTFARGVLTYAGLRAAEKLQFALRR